MTQLNLSATGHGPQSRDSMAPFLVSRCRGYSDAVAQLERFAKHDSVHVLLVGESGTGKSIFAEHLHARSPRATRVFHRVALSAIADSLAASELFGHLQGAFTDARSRRAGHFVSAHGGTLFLDEIGKASPVVQQNLLDAVERQEIAPVGADRSVRVDARIVAATNVSLHELANDGKFLPDLLARLDGFTVHIPPLRERRDDIPSLVEHLVAVNAARYGYARPPSVDNALLNRLVEADWPGNVRELDTAVRRILVEGDGAAVLSLRHSVVQAGVVCQVTRSRATAEEVANEVRRQGNVSSVARQFGLSRTTVYRYLGCAGDTPSDGSELGREQAC